MDLAKVGPVALLGSVLTVFSYTAASMPDVCDIKLDTHCATDFEAMSGNDNAGVIDGYWPSGWTEVFKTDGTSSGTYGGIDFSMTGGAPGSTSGNFVLNWSAEASLLPTFLDMVFTLKASNYHAAYFFDDKKITNESGGNPGTGSADGTWKIAFGTNGNDNKPIPALSHLSFYLRDGGSPPQNIPMPGTLLLAGLGLLGFGIPRIKGRRA